MTPPEPAPRHSAPVAVAVAMAAAMLALACCATVLVLRHVVGLPAAQGAGSLEDMALGTAWPLVGALVVRAQPRNAVGWLMLLPGFLGVYQACAVYAAWTDATGPVVDLAAWVAAWGFVPYFFTLPVLPHLFPDGRLPSRRWRPVLATVLALAAVTALACMLAPVPSDVARSVTNPWALTDGEWLRHVTRGGATTLFVAGVPLAVLSLALRLRRAEDVERTQLLWLLLGTLGLLIGAVLMPLSGRPGDWAFVLGMVAVPAGIGVAMLRHGLFDVELTLSRTVVFTALTAGVVAVYVGVVYGVQAVAPGSAWGVALVAVAALAAAAARDRVQELVDRWLFGHRHNPYAVVSGVGRQVAAASQPVDALQRLVDGLRAALRLPSAAFVGHGAGAGLAVASGLPAHGSRVVPCTALGAVVGELHVGLRQPHERWSAEEAAAIEELAARAGTLAYAAALVTDVADSRGRIVAAREEERRRLRADLHDGVAPSLAGTALQLESLARRLDARGEPELARRALDLRDGLRGTVTELRALVHGLRPPVLDQRGLAGALRQLVAGHDGEHDVPRCSAEVGDLGAPPAAVEVAAYALAAEAFGNALRHSSAGQVRVCARIEDGELVVAVEDNGIGMPPRPRAGVGMVSMRERAGEVGGRLEVTGTPGGGTTVRARLPLVVAMGPVQVPRPGGAA